jgi:hypothetical protein
MSSLEDKTRYCKDYVREKQGEENHSPYKNEENPKIQ